MLADKMQNYVAIIDDDDLFIDRIEEILAMDPAMRLFKSNKSDQLLDVLQNNQIDCILLDYDLGDDNGFRVAEKIREHIETPPPMIMLTGGGSERAAVKAFRSGMSDYLPKRNLSADELMNSIKRAIESGRRQRFARGRKLVAGDDDAYDNATGFYSQTFMRRYISDLAKAGDSRHRVLLVKIRNMEEIKKSAGMAACDQVFRAFVLRLRETVRDIDVWGRYAEFAFVCVCEAVGPDELRAFTARLRKRLTFEFQRNELVMNIKPDVSLITGWEQPETEEKDEFDARDDFDEDDDAEAMHLEKRRERRRRILKRGHIMTKAPAASIDCLVRNVSRSGAGIRLFDYYGLPKNLRLKIVGESEYEEAVLRWQAGCDAGLEFVNMDGGDGE